VTVTVSDFYGGAGGGGAGITQVPGTRLALAANHWPTAMATHEANFPGALHDTADLSQVSPRRYPRTDIGMFTPECTKHSRAAGRQRDGQPALFDDGLVDVDVEKSRATMWDVLRFAEHHRYPRLIVENVFEVRQWALWAPWCMGLTSLGYEWTVVSVNALYATALGPGAATSRDRLIVLAWRKGATAPDLARWTRPSAHCPECGPVAAVQGWRNPEVRVGSYGEQYDWRCPNASCRHQKVFPAVRTAADIIDRTAPALRIGERQPGTRTRPLVPATRARLQRGLDRYARTVGAEYTVPDLVSPYYSASSPRPADRPLPTITTRDRHGLLLGGRYRHLDDLRYRMFTVGEYMGASGFPPGYVLTGNREQQVIQIGNAVCPPMMRDLGAAQVEALTGERITRPEPKVAAAA